MFLRITTCQQVTLHYSPLGSQIITKFHPLSIKYLLLLQHFNSPLAVQFLHYFTTFDQITLTHHFTSFGNPNSYIILSPLIKLPPNSYSTSPTLSARFLELFTPSKQVTSLVLYHFYRLGSPIVTPF